MNTSKNSFPSLLIDPHIKQKHSKSGKRGIFLFHQLHLVLANFINHSTGKISQRVGKSEGGKIHISLAQPTLFWALISTP